MMRSWTVVFSSPISRCCRSLSIILLCCGATSVQAAAGNWTYFATCGSEGQQRIYWYQPGSISIRDGKKLVKLRGDYSGVAGSATDNVDIRWSVDCASQTFSELRRTEYRKDGKVVVKYAKPTGQMPINAGAVAGKLGGAICS